MVGSAGLAGLALGLLVAAQVGPIWLLVARTALRGRYVAGLAVGAGAAVVDLLYACLGVAGAAQLLRLPGLRVTLGLLGAGVLVLLGTRTLAAAWRVRAGAEATAELASASAALRTGLVATASNPLTIASWAAVFTAASTAAVATSLPSTIALLAGIATGSLVWFVLLATAMRLLGRRLGDGGLRMADTLAGLGLLGYGGLLGFRTLRDA